MTSEMTAYDKAAELILDCMEKAFYLEPKLQSERQQSHDAVVAICKYYLADKSAIANIAGDNLCWLTDETRGLAKALPEAEFLESCRRYRNQIATERGEFTGGKTIAQLEKENAWMEDAIRLASYACDDVIDTGNFAVHKVTALRWVEELKATLDRGLKPPCP